jgi:hypothetical protein
MVDREDQEVAPCPQQEEEEEDLAVILPTSAEGRGGTGQREGRTTGLDSEIHSPVLNMVLLLGRPRTCPGGLPADGRRSLQRAIQSHFVIC